MTPRRISGSCLAAALALPLAACVEIGPTVRVEAGRGKSQTDWDQDRKACMADTDRAVQPYADSLNADLGRGADRVRADNGLIQAAYDDRYGHCMAARGNRVEGVATATTPAPAPDDAVAIVREGLASSPPMDDVAQSAADYVEPRVRGFRAACPGEVIAVEVREASISPTVTSRLVALTEPHGGGCFGNKGEVDYLVARRDAGWGTLLEGLLWVVDTRNHGYADIEQQGPGTCVRTFSWDGTRYVPARERGC